jgi:hypothetical protein
LLLLLRSKQAAKLETEKGKILLHSCHEPITLEY